MRTLPANAEEVRILNSENNSEYYFTLRSDRLASFFQYVMANRPSPAPASAMPGISGPAHYGLDCIFFGPKPPRFPARDILQWLRDRLTADHSTPPEAVWVEVSVIEEALGKWAGTVPQLLADGTERA